MADHEAKIDLGITGLGPAEHIGRGGFADVYRAEQLSLRRTVAVKVLRAQASDPEAEARFERECHAIGAVSDHPHIVGVHEGGFTRNGRAYLVMEYLPGGSLYQRLAQNGPIPVSEVVDIGIKIGKALAVAHRTGVLHRDIKPANIMISAYGEPALGDFGIARIEGGHQTATGLVTASFAHAAPEVLEGHPPTTGADIYSLGSTIFELLTGRAPYFDPADESIWPLMKRILSEPMPSPESVGMSPRLGAVFARATARHGAERYHDAEELVEDLTVVASDPLSVTLYPPTGGGLAPPTKPLAPVDSQIDNRHGLGGRTLAGGLPVESLPPLAIRPDLTSVHRGDVAAPVHRGDAAPVHRGDAAPVHRGDAAPVHRGDAAPVHRGDAAPVHRGDAAPVHRGDAAPVTGGDTAPMSSPLFGLRSDGGPAIVSPRPIDEPDAGRPAAITMDLPAPVADRPVAPTRRAPRTTLLVVAAGLVLLAIAAGAWYSLGFRNRGTDRSAPTATSQLPAILSDPSGAALDGPLRIGEVVSADMADASDDAQIQLVVDGRAVGERGAGPVRYEVPAGRHSVAVEITTSSAAETTAATPIYVIGPSPAAGYQAYLASIHVERQGWDVAMEVFDRLVGEGHTNLALLVTDEFPALTPGFWTLYVPGFGDDAAAAEAYCGRFDLAIPTECYAGYLEP